MLDKVLLMMMVIIIDSDKFMEVIENAVKTVGTRTKYGINPNVLKRLESGIVNIPQVSHEHQYLGNN